MALDYPLPVPVAVSAQSCSSTVLTGDGVSAIRIGMPASAVKRSCRVLSDQTELGGEALPQRVLRVQVAGETLMVEPDEGRVWRVTVYSPKFRTDTGIGVGSTLAEVLRDGPASVLEGEGNLFLVSASHCGMSFQLDYEPKDDEHRANWTIADLTDLSPRSKVTQVLLVGCKR